MIKNYFLLSMLTVSMLLFSISPGFAQRTVSGKVSTFQENESLPGVNVLVKGTSIGTVTDVDGNYSIQIPGGSDVLVFSYVGYVSEEVPVGNRSVVNVQLLADIEQLTEVVVVGYGTQERARVTGAISTVTSKNIETLPVARIDQALQGQAAGVNVTNVGSPGTDPLIRIRGIGTVGNNNPLIVIDGMPAGGLNNINPNDIESIEILKDASAAAIYGSRAANGVVLITTKKGTRGRTKINAEAYTGTQAAWKKLDLLNREQYLAYGRDLQTNANQPIPQRFSNLGEFANVDTDWQDEMFRNASISEYNINVSGGSDNSLYNISGGYFNQQGIMLGTDFERYSFRANTDFSLGKFKVGQTLTLAYSDRNQEPFNGGRSQIEHMIKSVPYIPVRDAERLGGFRGPDNADGSDPANPVLNATLLTALRTDFKVLGTAFASYEIFDGLTYKLLFGLDANFGRSFDFAPQWDAGDYSKNQTADVSDSRSYFMSPLISNQLNFNKTFGNHFLEATAVVERQTWESSSAGGSGEFSTTSDIRVTGGVETPNSSGSLSEYALISYIGRVNYDYAGKYLLGATIRRDGGSRFGPGQKFGTFPSVSAGWRISEESFMESVPFVSDLKLRGSWGKTGNDGIGDYAYLATISSNFNYNFNGSLQPGATIRSLPNEDIKWETTVMTNIGMDLSMLDNKFNLTVEYFRNETQDMLLGVPIPPSLGYDVAPTANVGTVENKGWEFTAGYRKSTGAINFDLNANISFVNNELTSLGIGNTIFGPTFEGDPISFTEEGQPIAYFYGWVVDGIFQSQAEIQQYNEIDGNGATAYQNSSTAPGDIRFRDLNDDGVINANDRTYLGHFLPDFSYGLTGNASWKGFDVSIFFQGVSGNQILNTNIYDLEGMTRLFNAGTRVLNRWTPQNTNTDVPRAVTADPNRNSRISTRYIEDGSYLRIKNLSLGYSLPESLLSSFGNGFIKKVRVYLAGQNLLTITDYSGYDPEIGVRTGLNASLATGVDFGQFPQARTFIGGIQFGF